MNQPDPLNRMENAVRYLHLLSRLADPDGDLERGERDELSMLLDDLFQDITAGMKVLRPQKGGPV